MFYLCTPGVIIFVVYRTLTRDKIGKFKAEEVDRWKKGGGHLFLYFLLFLKSALALLEVLDVYHFNAMDVGTSLFESSETYCKFSGICKLFCYDLSQMLIVWHTFLFRKSIQDPFGPFGS